MNAIELLKEDHEMVLELLDQIDTVGENESKAVDLFGQLKQALSLHTEGEEKVFYPALSQFEKTKNRVEQAFTDHLEIDELVADISSLSPRDEEFLDHISELRERIENHVGEEEDELFPEAEELLGKSRLEELGRKIEQFSHRQTAAAHKRR